jgi:hypothetical protein
MKIIGDDGRIHREAIAVVTGRLDRRDGLRR